MIYFLALLQALDLYTTLIGLSGGYAVVESNGFILFIASIIGYIFAVVLVKLIAALVVWLIYLQAKKEAAQKFSPMRLAVYGSTAYYLIVVIHNFQLIYQ